MAAFLNTPSDFMTKPSRRKEPLKLLPPSEFEKPRHSLGTWADLKKATEEIQTLKVENQKLKDKIEGIAMSDSASSQPQGGMQRALIHDDRRYADELISRQAEELSKLRVQVQQLEHSQQTMRDDYEHRLAEAERQTEEAVASWSDSMQRREDEHDQEVNHLNRRHEGEVLDLKAQLEHLSSDLDRSKGDLTTQLAEVTEELYTLRKQAREAEDSLKQQIQAKDAELLSQAQKIEQLKTYITESDEQHKPQEVWVQQCKTLHNKLEVSEAHVEALQSSISLMEVRLSSMKEILLTQETEMSKGKENLTDKNKLEYLLLTRWREKVYALLVQLKTAQIVSKEDQQKWKEKTNGLENKLSSAHNTINILQHTVAEKEADVQLAANNNKKLQEDLNQALQKVQSKDDEISQCNHSLQQLAQTVPRYQEALEKQALALCQADSQLKAMGQRIRFAASRMTVLKSQMTRKEALKQLETKQQEPDPADMETEDSWRLEKDRLTEELALVSNERDVLAAQLQQDTQTWTENIASLRSQYDAEVSSLKRTVEDLELSNQEKSRTLDQLRQHAEVTQGELQEAMERVEHLGTELARHQHTMQQALEDQRKQIEEEFSEQLADMERKLNDARREHTKAVITLRQQERQWARERERVVEVQSTTDVHYTRQLEHLQHELQTIESERNLFMATLRQEGLLGKVRSERREPMKLELQEAVAMGSVLQDSHTETTTEVTETDSLQFAQDSSEPVSAVLEDLKSLVPALLDDSSDSSDENQS